MNSIRFTEDERDFLQEMLNVGYGAATAVISDMLETHITLHIPYVTLMTTNNIQEYVNNNFDENIDYYVFSQTFRGDLEGESLFITDWNSVQNLAAVIEADEVNDIEEVIDTAAEILNLVNSATLKTVANHLEKKVFFAQPSVKSIKCNEVIGQTNIGSYETIIVVSTVLDMQREDVKGVLYILFKNKTLELIQQNAYEYYKDE